MAMHLISAMLLAVLGQSDVQVVFFTAGWCQPCQQMRPAVNQLAQQGWQIDEIDVDRRRDLVQEHQISNLPTLLIMSGGREVDRAVGVTTYEQIHKRVQRAAARTSSGSARNGTVSPQNTVQASPVSRPTQAIVRGQSPGFSSVPKGLSTMAAANREHPQVDQRPGDSAQQSFAQNSTTELTPEQAMERAAAATVRIRVDEGNTTAHGTGTIIDVHGTDALVLTCGHLFRDMKPGSKLSIDLFSGTPREVSVSSELVDFRAEEEDIGLITFKLPVSVEPVELLPQGQQLTIGQPVFSFGCDHGQRATRINTSITNINRYLGAPNVEIAGAPIIGRSGGGLFDFQGRLVGVCNAADANDDEGIYAAAEVVYDQLRRLHLTHLFESPSDPNEPGPNLMVSGSTLGAAAGPDRREQEWPGEPQHRHGSIQPLPSHPAASNPASRLTSVRQLICIVQDVNGQDRVVTVKAPSAELMQRIEGASLAK